MDFNEPETELRFVSMCEFEGMIYACSEKGIYRVEDGELVRLKFKEDSK